MQELSRPPVKIPWFGIMFYNLIFRNIQDSDQNSEYLFNSTNKITRIFNQTWILKDLKWWVWRPTKSIWCCPAKFFGVLSARLSCNASVMRISVCDRFQIFGRYGPTKPAIAFQNFYRHWNTQLYKEFYYSIFERTTTFKRIERRMTKIDSDINTRSFVTTELEKICQFYQAFCVRLTICPAVTLP